jgi:hypothetical protein
MIMLMTHFAILSYTFPDPFCSLMGSHQGYEKSSTLKLCTTSLHQNLPITRFKSQPQSCEPWVSKQARDSDIAYSDSWWIGTMPLQCTYSKNVFMRIAFGFSKIRSRKKNNTAPGWFEKQKRILGVKGGSFRSKKMKTIVYLRT